MDFSTRVTALFSTAWITANRSLDNRSVDLSRDVIDNASLSAEDRHVYGIPGWRASKDYIWTREVRQTRIIFKGDAARRSLFLWELERAICFPPACRLLCNIHDAT